MNKYESQNFHQGGSLPGGWKPNWSLRQKEKKKKKKKKSYLRGTWVTVSFCEGVSMLVWPQSDLWCCSLILCVLCECGWTSLIVFFFFSSQTVCQEYLLIIILIDICADHFHPVIMRLKVQKKKTLQATFLLTEGFILTETGVFLAR